MPLKLIFQPAGDGRFLWACEADGFGGLVAAIIDDPDYETADVESRLVNRLRFADDIALIAQVNGRKLFVGDRDRAETINVASDESFIDSLDRLGFVSLEPGCREKRRLEPKDGKSR
jgi:hypothetical protein